MRTQTTAALVAALAVVLAASAPARAQAPINSNVALQPAKGGLIIRQQFRYTRADFDKNGANLDIQLVTSATTLVYGITDRFTVLLTTPVALSRRIQNNSTGTSDTDSGVADLTALAKLRLYRNDSTPTNTARFDVLLGAEIPSGDDVFSSDTVDPIVGGVYTIAYGRHALSADLLWKFNTAGGAAGTDAMRYDAAYSFRLAPAEYLTPNPTAWFALIELNGRYETNADSEVFLSPGVQYVTKRWIGEATIQLPAWQNLDHRPEAEYVIGLSVRVQF